MLYEYIITITLPDIGNLPTLTTDIKIEAGRELTADEIEQIKIQIESSYK